MKSQKVLSFLSCVLLFFALFFTTKANAATSLVGDLSFSQFEVSPATVAVDEKTHLLVKIHYDSSVAVAINATVYIDKQTMIFPPDFSNNGWDCTDSGDTYDCSYTIAPGDDSSLLDIELTAPSSTGDVTLSADVNSTDILPEDDGDNHAETTVHIGKANLSATKTSTPDTVALGDVYTYTIDIQNAARNGSITAPATNVRLEDTIDTDYLTITDYSGNTGWDCGATSSSKIDCTYTGTLDVDNAVSFTFKVQVTDSALPPGNTITNQAIVTSDTADWDDTDQNPQVQTTVTGTDLQLELQAPSTVLVGDSGVEYNATVRNTSAMNAENVKLAMTFTHAVTFKPSDSTLPSGWDCGNTATSTTFTCSYSSDLNETAGDQNLRLAFDFPDDWVGNDGYTFTVTSDPDIDTDTANNTVTGTTAVRGADLKIDKTQRVDDVAINDENTYTFTVTNVGQASAQNVYFEDSFTKTVKLVSYSDTNDWNCSVSGGDTFTSFGCTLKSDNGTLASGGSATLTMEVQLIEGEYTTDDHTVSNQATVHTSTKQEDTVSHTSATVTTNIQLPEIVVNKWIETANGGNDLTLGENFKFVIKVEEKSAFGVSAKNLVLDDNILDGSDLFTINSIESSDSHWICDANSLECEYDTDYAGGTTSIIEINATASSDTTGYYKNRATATSTTPFTGDKDDTVTGYIKGPDFTVSKTVTDPAVANETFDVNITLTNIGLSDAEDVRIVDDLKLGNVQFTWTPANPTDWDCTTNSTPERIDCTYTGNSGVFVGQSNLTEKLNFTVTAPNETGTYTNNVEVSSSTTGGPWDASDTFRVVGADIRAVKEVTTPSTGYGIANKPMTYTVTVTNSGNAEATDVWVHDVLDGRIDASTVTTSGCDNDPSGSLTVECNLPDIPSNGSRTFTISFTAPDINVSDFINEGNISTATVENDTTNNSYSLTSEIHGADIYVTKTVEGKTPVNGVYQASLEEEVVFDIVVRNTGEADAVDITLDDRSIDLEGTNQKILLTGIADDDGGKWSCANTFPATELSCSYSGTLAANGGSTTLKINATMPSTAGSKQNEANASAAVGAEYNPTNNLGIAKVDVQSYDLSVTKSVSTNEPIIDQNVTFTLAIRNNDLSDISNFWVRDYLPDGFTAVSASGSGWSCDDTTLYCEYNDTLGGNSGPLTIDVVATAPSTAGTYTNSADINSSNPDGDSNPGNNYDDIDFLLYGADLHIYKTDAPDPVAPGGTITYTISIDNAEGRVDAENVVISDTIPENTTYKDGSLSASNGWSCSLGGGTITCTKERLEKGADAEEVMTYQVVVDPDISVPNTIYNTVTSENDISEHDYTDNNITEPTEVRKVNLAVDKTADHAHRTPGEPETGYAGFGQEITYTLHFTNDSTTDIQIDDFNFTDTLPDNAAYLGYDENDNNWDCTEDLSSSPKTLTCSYKGAPLSRQQSVTGPAIYVKAPDANETNYDTSDYRNNSIVNRVEAQTSLTEDTYADNSASTVTYLMGTDMHIEKSDGTTDHEVGANAPLTYTLNVSNRNDQHNGLWGLSEAVNVRVVDTLPGDINVSDVNFTGTDSVWNCALDDHTVTCDANTTVASGGTLGPIVINTHAPNLLDANLTNTASVTNEIPELDQLLDDNEANVTTRVVGANIDIVVTADLDEAPMASPLEYTIVVRNLGKGEARDVSFTSNIQGVTDGFYFTTDFDNVPGWSCTETDANRTVTCNLDDPLPEGASAQAVFNAVTSTVTGALVNEVNASTSTVETNDYNVDNATTLIVGAELSLAVTPANDTGGAFMPKSYTFTLKNDGLSPTTDVNLTIDLEPISPDGFEVVDAEGTDWNCTVESNTSVKCEFGALDADEQTQVRLDVLLPNVERLVNIASFAEYVSLDDNLTSTDVSEANITVVGADLTLSKTVQNDLNATGYYDEIDAGIDQNVTFRLSVENRNLGQARDVNLTDTFDNLFTDIIPVETGEWNCSVNGQTLTCSIDELNQTSGALPANTIYVKAKTPTEPKPDGIENNASVASVTVETANGNPDEDTALVHVLGPELSGTLEANASVVAMEEEFLYYVRVENVGFSQSADINLTYAMPEGMRLVGSEDNSSWTTSTGLWHCSETNATPPVICEFSDNMPPYGEYSWITLRVKAPGYAGELDNNFTIVYDHESNITESPLVTVWPADIAAEAVADPSDEILAERNITYTIGIADLNISTAKDVNLSLDFTQADAAHNPTALYVSDTGNCDVNGTYLFCAFGDFAPFEERNITVTVTTPATDTAFTFGGRLDLNTSSEEADPDNDFDLPAVEVKPVLPIADWRLDDCMWTQEGDVTDQTGSHNGTAENGAYSYSMLLSKDENNRTSLCRSGFFDGVDDMIAIPNSPEINTAIHNKRSISLWFKADSVNDGTQVLYEEGGSLRGLVIYLKNGQVHVRGWNRPSSESDWDPGTDLAASVTPNVWHHVVLVLDARDYHYVQPDVFKGYLDGEEFASGPGSQLWGHGDAIGIGRVNGGTYIPGSRGAMPFGGLIDEVKIFNIALDDLAVSQIYDNEKAYKNFDGTERTCMVCNANLSVTIDTINDIDGAIGADSTLRYRITVDNNSTDPVAQDVNLTALFDTDLAFDGNLTIDSGWSCDELNTSNNMLQCYFLGDETNWLDPHSTSVFEVSFLTQNREYSVTSIANISIDRTNDGTPVSQVTTAVLGTDMAVTLDIPGTPERNSDFDIVVHIENLSDVTVAKSVSVQTLFGDLDYVGTTCPNPVIGAHNLECLFDDFAVHQSADFNITVRSNTALPSTTVSSDVNTTTFDRDMGNNHDEVTFSVAEANNTTGDILEQQFIDFRKHVAINRYGNMVVIGNSNLRPADSNDYDGYLADLNTSYVQTNGGLNSSQATLKLPDYADKIEYVGLYWSGHVHGQSGDTNDTGETVPYNKVELLTPFGDFNITVDTGSSATDDNITGYYYYKKSDGVYRRFYACEANITGYFLNYLEENNLTAASLSGGIYAVRGIQSNEGQDVYTYAPLPGNQWTSLLAYGNFSGWSMVVLYSVDHKAHRSVKFRNLALFDGYQKLAPVLPETNESIQLDIGGFITPVEGEIDSQIRLFTAGSERAVAAESMTITDKNGTAHEVYRDPVNPLGNILNDTIDLYYNDNTLIDRTLRLDYNPGIDIDQYEASDYLQNEQNETSIRLTASKPGVEGEQTFPSLITFATNIYTPDFIDSYKECFVEQPDGSYLGCDDENATIYRGSQIIYRITIVNTGDIYASHVTVVDPLPYQLDFDPDEAQFVVTAPKPLYRSDAVVDNILQPAGIEEINTSLAPGLKIPADMEASLFNPSNDVATEVFQDGDYNRTRLYINLDNAIMNEFPPKSFAWVEFRARVNVNAEINGTFTNTAIINFTNPTLEAFGYADANQSQEAASVGSPPVEFQWATLEGNVKDPGRTSVGTKIATYSTSPDGYWFDLNISVDDNATFAAYYPDVNLSIESIQFVDGDNGNTSIYPVWLTGGSFGEFPLLTDDDFNSSAWLPVTEGMSWQTNKIFHSAKAVRNVYFKVKFKIKIPGIADPIVSPYFKIYGDNFAIRPKEFVILTHPGDRNASFSLSGENYDVITAGHDFGFDIHAVDNFANSVAGYSTSIYPPDGTAFTVTADATCIPDPMADFTLPVDINFTDGDANISQSFAFRDVGYMTVTMSDDNWTLVDKVNNDCNDTNTSLDMNNSGLVSCAVDGKINLVFIPARIKINNGNVKTLFDGRNGEYTYMANDLDNMRTLLDITLIAQNENNESTPAFRRECYANEIDDLDIDFEINTSEPGGLALLWKDAAVAGTPPPLPAAGTPNFNPVTGDVSDLNVSADKFVANGEGNVSYAFNIPRNASVARMPVDFDTRLITGMLIDYNITIDGTNVHTGVNIPVYSDVLSGSAVSHFWYARLHAPDYRSQTATTPTPIFVEVYCALPIGQCQPFGFGSFPESSDDVNWWVNTLDTHAITLDLNATQKNTPDPDILINGLANNVTAVPVIIKGSTKNDINVTYTGNRTLYKTRILMDSNESWLYYDRFNTGLPLNYHVEFDLPTDRWSGIGETGVTVETNGSMKSNRRLEW